MSAFDVPSHIWSETAEPSGRFRPLYWLGQSVELATAGQHVGWWYVDRLILACVTLALLFLAAVRFVGPLPAAAITLLPFCGPQVETWVRLGPNEAYAMPLAAGGLLLLVVSIKRGLWNPGQSAAGYALLVLAALAKENFIALAPAALLGMSVRWGAFRRRDWVTVGSVAVVTVADLAMILWKVHQYGTLYPQTRTARTVLQHLRLVAETQSRYTLLFVAAAAAIVLAGLARDRRASWLGVLGVGTVVGLLLVLPQSIILAGTATEGRYFYPVAVFATVIWGLAFWVGNRLRRWRTAITIGLLVVLVLPLARGYALGRDQAVDFATRSGATQAQLDRIERVARSTGTRSIVLQPLRVGTDFEAVASLATYLTKQHGLTVSTLPAPTTVDGFGATLDQRLLEWSRGGEPAHFLVPYRADRGRCLAVQLGPQEPACSSRIVVSVR